MLEGQVVNGALSVRVPGESGSAEVLVQGVGLGQLSWDRSCTVHDFVNFTKSVEVRVEGALPPDSFLVTCAGRSEIGPDGSTTVTLPSAPCSMAVWSIDDRGWVSTGTGFLLGADQDGVVTLEPPDGSDYRAPDQYLGELNNTIQALTNHCEGKVDAAGCLDKLVEPLEDEHELFSRMVESHLSLGAEAQNGAPQ